MKLSTNSAGPAIPEGEAVFAVGDVHGRFDLLQRATREIADYARAHPDERVTAVFLGDYIDRGPDAAKVVRHLRALESEAGYRCVFLRGNHEQVMCDLLDGEEESTRWLDYGGGDTLTSYSGGALPAEAKEDVHVLREFAAHAIPEEDLAFIRRTEHYVAIGDYIFVHAGLRPDRLLEEQSVSDFLWYRYYDDQAPLWSQVVVHGHSVNERPIRGQWRIGIDTGAYSTGRLTVLKLAGDRQEFLKIEAIEPGAPPGVEPWPVIDRAFRDGSLRSVRETSSSAGRRSKSKGKGPSSRRGPSRGIVAAASVGGMVVALGLAIAGASTLSDHPPGNGRAGASDHLRPAVGPQPAPTLVLPQEPAPPKTAEATNAALQLAEAEAPSRQSAPATATVREDAPPPSPPPLPPPPDRSAAPKGVHVQIGAMPSEKMAAGTWDRLVRSHPGEVKEKSLVIQSVSKEGRTLYRSLVVGFSTVGEAKGFCDRLQLDGQACIIRGS